MFVKFHDNFLIIPSPAPPLPSPTLPYPPSVKGEL